jgi:hypothetical protein
MSDYRQIVIENYKDWSEGGRIRARPLPGQGYSTNLNVECSKSMREKHPAGTKFLIWAKLTTAEHGVPFLYSSYKWAYEVYDEKQAKKFIRENFKKS